VFVFPRNLTVAEVIEMELRDDGPAVRNDLLESVLGRKDAVGERLNRVLSKIKSGKQRERVSYTLESLDGDRRSASISEYSMDEPASDRAIRQCSVSPLAASGTGTPPKSRSFSEKGSMPGTATPTGRPAAAIAGSNRRSTPFSAPSSPTRRSYATPTPTLKQQSGQKNRNRSRCHSVGS